MHDINSYTFCDPKLIDIALFLRTVMHINQFIHYSMYVCMYVLDYYFVFDYNLNVE